MNNFKTRLEALFEECLQQPPEKQETFLKVSCGDDQELYDRVLVLIRAHRNAGDFLESLPHEDSNLVASQLQRIAPAEESVGDQIGRYRLIELIGEGSHGSVWLAEQTEDIKRRVALKILKLGLDTKEFLARFEVEKQVLALFDHPGIATVLDAGATSYGRPYFVMELVEGKPLWEFADEQCLNIEDRVRLFIKVCQALHHAHQNGIIHRDLKPSNILTSLVDKEANPKIIDFGIAKTTEQRLTEKTLLTGINTFIGTPVYCSPEQLDHGGSKVDHRSDIYSMGALLYEFLSGQTPFNFHQLSTDGMEAFRTIVREKVPTLPSSRFDALSTEEQERIAEKRHSARSKIESRLKGDLDWIIMKSLEKEPDRRYESADALAQDLQAYLDGKPVSAAAPSSLYRIRKYITRKRPPYAVWLEVSLVIVTMLAAIFYFRSVPDTESYVQSQSPIANHEQIKSIAVLPLENLSERDDDEFFADGIHLDLLTEISRINDIKSISPQSVKSYKGTSKDSRSIGEELGVATLLTGGVQRSGDRIQINIFLVEAATGANLWSESFVRELNTAAEIFSIRNQVASAVTDRLHAVLTPREIKSFERVPTQNLKALEAYFRGREILATDLRSRMQEAGEYFQKAIDLDPEFAQAYTSLANALIRRTGLTGDRLDPYISSEEGRKKATELISKALELNPDLAEGHTLQGRFQIEGGDYIGAEASYKRALELNPNYALAWNEYASLQKDKEAMFAMVQKSIALDPSNANFKSDLILQLCWFARFDEAIAVGEELIRTNPLYPRAYWLTAAVWMDAFGRYDKGVELLRKGAAVDPRDVWVNNYLVMAYVFMGDSAEAARWQGLKMTLKMDPPDLLQQFDLHRLRGEEEQALEACREYLHQGGDEFRAWRYVLNADLRAGRYEEARARYETMTPYLFEEDPVIEVHGGRDFNSRYEKPRMAMQLASILYGTGEVEQATKLLERGWELFKERPLMGSDGRFGYGIRDVVQHTLKGRKKEALDALREAVEAGYRDRWFIDCAELDPLRDDPGFIVLRNEIEDDLARQLANVRRMEANGELAPFPDFSENGSAVSDLFSNK